MSNPAATPALSIRNAQKTYRLGKAEVRVLRGVDADFAAGEVTMIQGASGSGKSTLLHTLGGIDRPDSGTVNWHGESVYGWGRNRLAVWRNRHVGFIFQNYQLLPELTAVENVNLPTMLDRRGDPEAARSLLESVGLGDRTDHRPGELSGGEQQRVAIARALCNDPDLLLADEPTGNLDATTGREIMDLLLQLQQERKKTLIVVTHDDKVAGLAGQRRVLADGTLTL